ncbi:MAG: glycosyltransferase [Lachnospiraceae bacterium]|nr:glycosyltransferase [Lachnospiraceae bacterium]
MKLTHLTKIYFPDNGGGISQAVETVTDGFRDMEQEVICCQRKPGIETVEDTYEGIPVLRCKQFLDVASTPFSFRFLKEMKRRGANDGITIYNFPYPLCDIGILFHCYRGKLVLWWHCDFVSYKRLAPFYRPFVKHSLKKADMILVSSDGTIDGSDLLPQFRDKCLKVPYSISDEHLRAGEEYVEKYGYGVSACVKISDEEGAASLELDDGSVNGNHVHMLFLGRLVWYKGGDLLLHVLKRLVEEEKIDAEGNTPVYDLTFVGGGPKQEELEALTADLGLTDRVRFTGMVSEEEKREEIRRSDFLVLPSTSEAESFAIVQIEAMAFGKPVINTRLNSGVPYVSIDGETGLTVTPGSEDELLQAIKTLGKSKDLRERYGRAAYERVQAEYTREKMIRRLKDGLETLYKGEKM